MRDYRAGFSHISTLETSNGGISGGFVAIRGNASPHHQQRTDRTVVVVRTLDADFDVTSSNGDMTIRGIEVTVKDASATVLRGTVDGAGDTIVVRTSNDVIGVTGIPQGVGVLSPFDSRRISKMLYPVSAHLRMNGGDGWWQVKDQKRRSAREMSSRSIW